MAALRKNKWENGTQEATGLGRGKGTKRKLEIVYSHRSGEQHTVIILTWKALDSARDRDHTEDIQF